MKIFTNLIPIKRFNEFKFFLKTHFLGRFFCSLLLSPKLANHLNLSLSLPVLNSAEIIRLNVPSRAYEGDSAQLRCVYALTQGERLYSLKWLLGKSEFYRETYREQDNGKLAQPFREKKMFPFRGKFVIDVSFLIRNLEV